MEWYAVLYFFVAFVLVYVVAMIILNEYKGDDYE